MLNKTVFERYSLSVQVYESDLIVVYSGKDRQTNETIGVTVIKPGIISAKDFLARFEPLAKTIAQINSSHIIKALEFGEADGQAVIVWEDVDGKSLANMLAGGNGLPLDISLDLALQLGEYLDAIHNHKIMQGVFHPEDILLSDENATRVTNLGIWRAINVSEALSSGKTKAAPCHAPELARGERETIRADFYSLGVLLYKVLTGKDPDTSADPLPSRLRTDIPGEWDELIAKCMHLDPAKRVQSAAEFIGKLDEMRRATKIGKGHSVMGMEDSLIGHTLGAYRLVERLGQGGMATVYKAYEAALDRYVAIKVLPQFFANDPMFAQRFRREAKAVAQLNHPNIVPIYSYGEENGITYIAMQFIEGGTLKHEGERVYRSEDALRLLLPIARALGYAHKRGVIHRDVKPSNVLVSEDNWPVLADFGLAQMAQASVKLTETGVGMGTPTYMSPEQGQGDKVDHRTDIYSFGIMLYELVTGEAPFRADTPMAIVIKHLTAPMPMPRQINPNIPEEVETLILKATAKDPDDRYQTAEEMALAMERALNLPSVIKEERSVATPSPRHVETVASLPPTPIVHPSVVAAVPQKKTSKAKKISMIFLIAVLLILGLPYLGVTLMGIFDICPPEGPWSQPSWCAGPPYVVPSINPPIVETSPIPMTTESKTPPTPIITEGKLGDILFQDDFEGGISSRWQFTSSPYLVPWVAEEFEGRTVFHSLPANPPGEISDAEIRGTHWENYAIQFDFRFLKPDQFGYHYFTLRGRLTECPPTVRSVQMYEAIISPDEGILKKSVCKEGSQQEIASSDKDFDAEGWHTLQYIFIGNRIQLLIDGKSFFDYIDAQDGLAGGDIWIETGGSAEMLFDNFKAYEIVTFAAAPSATEAPSTSLPAEACAPGQKVLYVEDFQDGQAQGWNTIQSSLNGSEPFGWSVIDEEGNKILVEAKRSSGGDEMSRFTADNFVWHAKFKVSGNDAGVFFMWRISYTGDGMRKRYVAVFGAQEKPFMIRFLDEPSGTTPTNVGSGPRDMLKQDRWYDITIAYFNGTHQVWYDGKKQIEYQDANPFPAGTIGFETHLDESKASHFFIDDLVICELTAPYEPTQ